MTSLDTMRRIRADGEVPVEQAVRDAGFAMTARQITYAIRHGHVCRNGRRVRLDAFRVGRRWLSSVPAVQRYVAALNELTLADAAGELATA